MALFKISKGLKANLPSTKTVGYCWYTTDDSLFYIDYEDENGEVQRKALNAKDAETLTGASLSTILSSSDIEIPTSKAVMDALANKSDVGHTHDDRYYTEAEVDSKLSGKSDTNHTHSNYVPTTRTVNGKALSANITLSASDVGALPDSTDIPSALSDLTADSTHRTVTDAEKATWNAKSDFSGSYNDLTNKPSIPSIEGLATETYVDTAIAVIPTPDVSGQISTHNTDTSAHSDIRDLIDTKVDKVSGKGLSTNDYTTTEKNKLAGIATGAEVNQNAFSNVVVGSTTIAADSETDSLTIAAGTGISVAGDATNDKVTITNSGVRSISAGTSNGTISVNTNGTSADVAVKGLGSAAYTASTAYDAAGTAQTKADAALASAKEYADGIKNDLLNGAGTAYDTLKELGDLIDTNVDAIDALETVAASKADASALTSHTSNKSNPHGVTLAQLGVTATAAELNIMDGVTATAAEINKLDGLTATTAELNYVDGVTSNIQTQLDAKSDSGHTHSAATQSAAGLMSAADKKKLDGVATGANAYTHPSYTAKSSGLYKVTVDATGHVSGTAAVAKSDITALGIPAQDTTYSAATTSAAGLMSAADKSKLDGITAGANKYTLPVATSSAIGGVKSGTDITVDSSGNVSVNDDSHNHIISNVDGLQAALDAKAASSHTHSYAGSSSAGGAATSAVKLSTARAINGVSFDGTADIDIVAMGGVTTAGDGSAYTATVPGIDALTAGVSFVMVPHVVSASTAPTLNVNGLGAKYIRRRLSNLATSLQAGYTNTWLPANKPFTVVYDGTAWVVEGMSKPVAADIYGTVAKATGDANGNSIIDTYATKAELQAYSPFVISSTAPTNTAVLWIDSSLGGVLKYYDGSAWTAILSVYHE